MTFMSQIKKITMSFTNQLKDSVTVTSLYLIQSIKSSLDYTVKLTVKGE